MSIYLLDHLPARTLTWTFLMDPNKRHGALLTGIDYEGNVYVVDEHYAENIPDSEHVKHYQDILTRHKLTVQQVAFFADPGGAGAQAIINIADLGIFAQSVRKDAGSVKASIELIRRAAWVDPSHAHPITGKKGAPHLYFLKTLKSQWTEDGVDYHESRLLWELRQYRQKKDAPPDTPVKEKDDVTDCLDGDTLVETVMGPVPIRDMVGTAGLLHAPSGLRAYHSVRATHGGVPQPVIRLWFEDGRHLTCTPSHLLLTPDGWRRAGSGCDSVLDISQRIGYFCGHEPNHRRSSDPAISGTEVRPDQGRVLSLHEQVSPPRGVESGQRPDPRRVGYSPQGRESSAQLAGQSGGPAERDAPGLPHDTRETGSQWCAAQGAPSDHLAIGGSMASLPGGEGMAPGTWPGVFLSATEELSVGDPHMHRVWDGVYSPSFTPGFLLQRLQVGGSEEIGGGRRGADVRAVPETFHGESVQQGAALLEVMCRPVALSITQVEKLIDPVVVYNMEVETDESYAVAGGLIVHNCLRYHFLVRPFTPTLAPKPDEELLKLDQLSRMEVERFDKVEKEINRPRERRDDWMGT